MKSGYLIWPTRTPTWAVHTYGITADAVRSALARDVMSPKQQVALICIVGQKTNSQNGKKNDRLVWPITHVESAEMTADVADLSDHTK